MLVWSINFRRFGYESYKQPRPILKHLKDFNQITTTPSLNFLPLRILKATENFISPLKMLLFQGNANHPKCKPHFSQECFQLM